MSNREQVQVIIDSREDGDVISDLGAYFAVNDDVADWNVDYLSAGDLDIHGVGFERKTMNDYVSSLTEGRLVEQAEKLTQAYEHAYVLIEGDLTDAEVTESNISSAAVRGSMASLMARQGLPVLCVSNRALLADMAVRLARKHIEEASTAHLPKGEVTQPDAPTALKMYGCLPGVGRTRAEALYERWPSVVDFVTGATRENIAALDGFGDETAERIVEALL